MGRGRHPTFEELGMVPMFDEVDGRDLKLLAQASELAVYGAGMEIFREGAPGDAMYFILSGQVEIIKKTADGKPKVLALLPKGTVLGEMSLVDSAPRSASAIAKTDVKMVLMEKHAFQRLTDEHPRPACKIMLKLLRTLSMRLRQSDSRLVDSDKS